MIKLFPELLSNANNSILISMICLHTVKGLNNSVLLLSGTLICKVNLATVVEDDTKDPFSMCVCVCVCVSICG